MKAKSELAKLACLVVALAAVCWWARVFDKRQPVAVHEERKPALSKGSVVTLRRTDGTPFAVNLTAYKNMLTLSAKKDHASLTALIESGVIGILESGTKGKITETGVLTYRLAVLDGPHKGKDAFVAAEHVH